MAFNLNIIPTTIKALTTFVQVLDQHRFGAVMLLIMMVAAGALMAVRLWRCHTYRPLPWHDQCRGKCRKCGRWSARGMFSLPPNLSQWPVSRPWRYFCELVDTGAGFDLLD
jgi:hypothetical protein